MNVSSTFGKWKTKRYELTGTQRLMVLGAIGMIVLLLVFITTSDVEVAVGPNPPNTNSQGIGKTPSKSESQGFQVSPVTQSMRDPFALPPQLQEQNNENSRITQPPTTSANISNYVPAASVSSTVPKSAASAISYDNPRLTGIVGTEGRNLAVIMSGGKSKSYSINEFVGPYKVMAITNEYVILANGDHKLTLRLETAGQKGGNHSEK